MYWGGSVKYNYQKVTGNVFVKEILAGKVVEEL